MAYGDYEDEEDDDQEEPEEVVHSNETESEEESGLSEISDDTSDDDVSNNDDSNDDDALTSVHEAILETWRSVSPERISEKTLLGKWYAIIYSNAKKPMLYIGKFEKRWLYDEGGAVTHIDLCCLKSKSGSGTVLEETPKHLGKYSDKIPLIDIIAGPLQVEPLKGNKINIPVYQDVLRSLVFRLPKCANQRSQIRLFV